MVIVKISLLFAQILSILILKHLTSSKDIIFLLNYFISFFVKLCYFEFGLKCMNLFWSVKNLFLDECYIFVELYYFECRLKT